MPKQNPSSRPRQGSPGPDVPGYEVESILGSGAHATVYRVRHGVHGQLYALKVLHVASDGLRVRLMREAKVQAALRHPNIVAVLDVLSVGDQPALLMEYVDGPTLEVALEAGPRFTLPEIDRLARGIAAGVEAAHRAGWLHRDLKPSNVLVARIDGEPVARITDFGLARLRGDRTPSVTQTGQIYGTPCYMAPEQFKNAKTVDARADVFSLGCVLYELVSGRRAFWPEDGSGDLLEIHDRIRAGEYRSLAGSGLPERMIEAITSALVPDPTRRIADCDTFLSVWEGRAHTLDGIALDFTASESPTVMVDVYGASGAWVPEQSALRTIVEEAQAEHLQELRSVRSGEAGLARVWAALATVMALAVTLGLGGVAVAVWGLVMALDEEPTVGMASRLELPQRRRVEASVAPVAVAETVDEVPEPVVRIARAVQTGELTVTLVSDGGLGWANVWIDGQDIGRRAPFRTLPVEAGVHRIRVENPHHDGVLLEAEIEIVPGETTVVPVRF